MKGKRFKKIATPVLLLVLLILVMVQLVGEDASSVGQMLLALRGRTIVTLFLCAAGFMVVEGVISALLVRESVPGFSLWTGVKSGFYVGAVRAPTFGLGSAAALIVYLRKEHVPVAWGYGVASLAYACHKVMILGLALLGLGTCYPLLREAFGVYLPLLWVGCALTAAIVVGLLLLCLWRPAHRAARWLLGKIAQRGRFQNIAEEAGEKLSQLRKNARLCLQNKKKMALILLLEAAKMGFWYSIPFFTLQGMGVPCQLIQTMSLIAMVTALAGVIPTPGGVASVEVLFTLFFTPAVGEVPAMAAMVVYRFLTYYGSCFLAMVVLLIVRLVEKRRSCLCEDLPPEEFLRTKNEK